MIKYLSSAEAKNLSPNMITVSLIILMTSNEVEDLNLSLYVIHQSINSDDHLKYHLIKKSFLILIF